METQTRTWTDDRDEAAYDTFRTLAEDKGGPGAVDMMYRIMDMGAAFGDQDIRAWVLRYEDEEDVLPHPPHHPIDREYARLYDRYQRVKA